MLRRKIDAHLHIDRIREPIPVPVDFRSPPPFDLVVDELLEQMDKEQVEAAVIMQHPNNPLNEVIGRLLAEKPDRFQGAAVLPLESAREAVAELERSAAAGIHAVKFEMFGTEILYPGFRLDGSVAEAVFEAAQERGVVITIDPSRPGTAAYQPAALERMTGKYPGLQFVICHLGFAHHGLLQDAGNRRSWERMIGLAQQPNVAFDAAAMPDLYCESERWPYPSALLRVRRFMDTYGAEKLMWGSDLPGELKVNSYNQIAAMFDDSPMFTDAEKNLLFYDNAKRIYFKNPDRSKGGM